MEINDQNFNQEVIKSQLPVLADFYAEWCGPCKMLAPVIEELEKEYQGRFKIVKLDVDANPITSSQYEVMSIPTLIFFKNGQIAERLMGSQSKNSLKDIIDKLI